MLAYKVVVLNTMQDYFYYAARDVAPKIGARVWVPFRNSKKVGVIIGCEELSNLSFSLKYIAEVIDNEPLLPKDILQLVNWVSEYYKSPLSQVLKLAIPKKYRQGQAVSLPVEEYYKLHAKYLESYQQLSTRAKKQREIVEYIKEVGNRVLKKSLNSMGYTNQQLQHLVDKNILVYAAEIKPVVNNAHKTSYPLELNLEQSVAVDSISSAFNTYKCFLLKGVTGSGKTEVYLQVIAKVLNNNQQVLVIVPEIGLTPQLLTRFSSRFRESIQVLHSSLNDTERQCAWQRAKDKQARLIIGTRTAVFTPMPDLGLIIIDEEHDLSLKQMEGVRYFARDTALVRASNANIPIVLGSATPSLESLYNCNRNKYTMLELKQKAVANVPLHYQLLDIRNKNLENGFAKDTLKTISQHLELGNQVLVFINRRGFAPVLYCHDCANIEDCRNCDTHLSLHSSVNKLICHHCGYITKVVSCCSVCQGANIVAVGVGTQRVYEYLSSVFPTTSMLRIDRDEVTQKNSLSEKLELINSGDAQLIVGTQMLAKGHHFPKLTLVVILDVDNGFFSQDFRALERLGQLLVQVAGRAGREEIPGQVLIQTSIPDDPLLNILIQEGYDSFVNLLLEAREKSSLPPYSYLAMLRAENKNQQRLLEFMHLVKNNINSHSVKAFGPAPAPIQKKRGNYRMQILLKSVSRKELHITLRALRVWLDSNKLASGMRVSIDVDPLEVS